MDRKEFFQNIGFGEYESKILSSLIKLGAATPKEISLDSGVPQNKLYSILKKFELDGILSEVPSSSKKYKLINIKQFIEERINEQEIKLKDLKKFSKDIQKINDPEDNFTFSLIKGQRAIMNKLSEANEKATKEIFGVQRNWRYWGEGIRAMKQSLKKGADVRMIGVVNDETWKRAKEWKKVGGKLAKYNGKFGEHPLRFTIFDQKFARITIGRPEIKERKDYVTIWTDCKPLVMMLRNQFLEMWKECEKV
ncbi:hypothetical protein GOV13_02030 [Candidatus Pacearchaeota archaeon]|nr:hypothetical protein [Candidatus Pacearchaeota archaeon]